MAITSALSDSLAGSSTAWLIRAVERIPQRTGSIGASSTLRLVDLQQVARGLRRWALRHPEWEPPEQEDSPADWPAEVGCVAYETPNTLVLIDPLVVDGIMRLSTLAPRERNAL